MNSQIFQEINQQPQILDALINKHFRQIQEIAKNIYGKFDSIYIAARGTSDNAAIYAKYLFGIRNEVPVTLATPSIFSIYEKRVRFKNTLVLGISQSGQSPDINMVLEEAQRQNAPTIAVTNKPSSPLADNADFVIDLNAGEEKAVAATKTYTASLLALTLLSLALQDDNPDLGDVRKIPKQVSSVLNNCEKQLVNICDFKDIEDCVVLGRGYNYSTSFEIALKVKELTQIHAEAFSSADFMHGPISILDASVPIILIAVKGKTLEDSYTLLENLKERQSKIIGISNDKTVLEKCAVPLSIVEDVQEYLSPILAVLPGQLLVAKLAVCKGFDPDRPEGLTKVTKTI